MFEVRADILNNRPIEEVFNFIVENENDPQWCVPVVETIRIEGDAPRIGARYRFVSKMGLMKLTGEFEILVFKPPSEWKGLVKVH